MRASHELVDPLHVFAPLCTEDVYQFSCCNAVTVIRSHVIEACVFFILILLFRYRQIPLQEVLTHADMVLWNVGYAQ